MIFWQREGLSPLFITLMALIFGQLKGDVLFSFCFK